MFTIGLIILNYILIGGVLLLGFAVFNRLTTATEPAPETTHNEVTNTTPIPVRDSSSLQTVA